MSLLYDKQKGTQKSQGDPGARNRAGWLVTVQGAEYSLVVEPLQASCRRGQRLVVLTPRLARGISGKRAR